MTTTINLLPWREERRKQRQQEFVMMLILAAIAVSYTHLTLPTTPYV